MHFNANGSNGIVLKFTDFLIKKCYHKLTLKLDQSAEDAEYDRQKCWA
jgi:hypothetical protein